MRLFKPQLGIALLCVIILSGCVLERRPLYAGYSKLSPRVYCPGDDLTASYDFLGTDSCPAGVDCSPYFPSVTVSSETALFAPRTTRAYSGSLNFRSAGNTVTVISETPSESVLIPTDRFQDGNRVFIDRTVHERREIRVSTIYGGEQQTLNHAGMCAGATPAYSAGEAWSAPQVSSRLVANRLCNTSSVPIIATVSYLSVPGLTTPDAVLTLGIAECRDLTRADLPVAPTPNRISVRPQTPDLSARCGALDGAAPPRNLSTSLGYACRL
jgi:hypothetical protein